MGLHLLLIGLLNPIGIALGHQFLVDESDILETKTKNKIQSKLS